MGETATPATATPPPGAASTRPCSRWPQRRCDREDVEREGAGCGFDGADASIGTAGDGVSRMTLKFAGAPPRSRKSVARYRIGAAAGELVDAEGSTTGDEDATGAGTNALKSPANAACRLGSRETGP